LPLVKIRGGVGKIPEYKKLSFTYDQTSGIHLMDSLSVATESKAMIKKEEK